jgi:nitronate monooxygenase
VLWTASTSADLESVASPVEDLLGNRVVVAPMAGGPSTVSLVVASAEAGSLGFLAGAYKIADEMEAEILAVQAATASPFGVNLFVPGEPTDRPELVRRYARSLQPDADALGVTLGAAVFNDDDWDDKIGTLLGHAVPVVSFTFGCPSVEVLESFREVGTTTVVTVTDPAEARVATAAGADVLCVQGADAGAHRSTFSVSDEPNRRSVLQLLDEVQTVCDRPLLAAGGIVSRDHVRSVLARGALAAQCGTVFLRCPESGTTATHRAALVDPRFSSTAVTRAFTGRPARGLVNRFMEDHRDAPAAFPEINSVTRPLRAAAARAGDAERLNLWAGTGFRHAAERPVAEVIESLSP